VDVTDKTVLHRTSINSYHQFNYRKLLILFDNSTIFNLDELLQFRTFNPFVVGSTPAGPTKNLKKDLEKSKSFFYFRMNCSFYRNW
jgi:hypothetical protein